MDERRWERLSRLFEEALALTGDARAAFLDEACADDAPLRDEVEALLASHDRTDSVIGEAVASVASEAFATGGLPKGHRIGAWEILKPLGKGGMGEVYLAARADAEYRQEAAIKIVRSGLDSPEILRRFLAERQILANLGHANIARLIDGGTTESGAAYFVMEYVDGEPIHRYCDAHGLDTRARLALFRQVCFAVQHAHANLVVHRDIKPSNILVTADGIPKLLDFGIAKLLDPGTAGAEPAVTRTMMRLLTPEYSSPEQVKGEPITTATDVYSLGVLLYQILTGRLPYEPPSDKQADLERAICETPPERPSTAVTRGGASSPKAARRELRGDLDNVVLMALRKEPERRYLSAGQFSEDIQRYLDGQPVLARQDTWSYRASRFIARNRAGVAAATVVVVLLVGVSVTTTLQSFRIARERDRAVAAEARADRQAATAEQVSRFMVELFGGVDPEEARGREVTAREILDRGAERIRRELSEQPEIRARLQGTIGEVYTTLGVYDEATPLLEESLRQLVALEGEESLEVARARVRLAALRQTRGDYDEADTQLTQALAVREKLLPPDHADVAGSLDSLGLLRRAQGRYDEAEDLIRRALASARAAAGAEQRNPTVAKYTGHLGLVLQEKGKSADAEAAFREALAMQVDLLGEDHPEVVTTLSNLGNVLANQNRYDEAEALLTKGLGLLRKLYGDEHIAVATQINNIAAFYKSKGDLEAAEASQREALAMFRKLLGEEHPRVAMCYNNLANILQDEGNLSAAEAMHRKSLALNRKLLGNEHPRVGDCLNNLANLLWEEGKFAESERLYREALALDRKLLGDGHPYVAMDLNALGLVLRDQGHFDDALPLVDEAIGIIQRAEGDDSLNMALYLGARAALYLRMGRAADAEPEVGSALKIQESQLPAGHWRILQTRSIQGEVLAALGRGQEAERLLVDSYEALREQLGERNGYTRRAKQAVRAFYQSTGRPDRAAAYAGAP